MPGNSVKRADRNAGAPSWRALGAAVLLLAGGSAFAQDTRDLNRLEGEIRTQKERGQALTEKSKALTKELKKLRRESISTARAIQESEAILSRLEADLEKTRDDLAAREAALREGSQQLGGTLSALERLSRNPPRALLMSPGKPIDAVRRAMLLRAALPVIQGRADDLRTEIAALGETRADLQRQLAALARMREGHARQRKELESIIGRKAGLLTQTEVERRRNAKRLKDLARKARTLKELFARLDAERQVDPLDQFETEEDFGELAPPVPAPNPSKKRSSPPKRAPVAAPKPAPVPVPAPSAGRTQTALLTLPRPDALRPFPDQGSITVPARGKVTGRYGESTGYGNTAKGITIQTRAGAQIVAPYDGKVVFAGPFRGYQQILIIEHTGGYHTLLAGMDQVDTGVGQWLLAGEPVGLMADSKNGIPRLYFELRRRGQPVNPLPWFAEYRKRARG